MCLALGVAECHSGIGGEARKSRPSRASSIRLTLTMKRWLAGADNEAPGDRRGRIPTEHGKAY